MNTPTDLCPTCKGSGFVWERASMKLPGGKRWRCDYQTFCPTCQGSGKAQPPEPMRRAKGFHKPDDDRR